MKKYLLLIIMMVCAATGAWAQDYSSYYSKSNSAMTLHTPESSDQYVYWYDADEAAADAVLTINVPTDHSVSLATIATEALGSGSYTRVQINGPITDGDITTINGINAIILDLSGATLEKNESGTYTADNSILESAVNSNVKFLVLPAGMTRDDVTENNVTTEGIVNARSLSGFSGLYSAVSFSDYTSTGSSSRDVVAYCRVAGTLQPGFVATDRGSLNGSVYTRSGHTCYFPDVHCLDNRSATLSGNLNAYDMLCQPQTNGKDAKLDKNGHLTFDKKYADESSLTDDRTNIGTESIYGAFSNSNGVQTLDLRDAVFAEINDMTISYLQSTNYLTYLTIPTSSSVIETPSYFIQHNLVKEICIPSNIQKIRTHFAPSIDHIWTTAASGDIAGTVYDNGVLPSATGDLIYGHSGLTFQKAAYPCGTYTFSSNLKLIESNAFANTEPHVKDIYVLAVETPECHVDAFCTAMYVGNGGYAPTIVDGVITRDSYLNGTNWIAMLHYPRECVTPEVQRYTDPTRKYTTASNEIDGKGGVLYYPNYSEFLAAYAQGTTGYLWNAWSLEYEYGQLQQTLYIGNSPWTEAVQKQANDTYLANPKRAQNPYTSFYDVTADGLYSQPEGLEPYYNIYWDERDLSTSGTDAQHLYPAAETSSTEKTFRYLDATEEDFANDIQLYTYNNNTKVYTAASPNVWAANTYYKRIQKQQTNLDGSLKYKTCSTGLYVQDTRWVEDAEGTHVRSTEPESYAATQVPVSGTTYYTDNTGITEATPKVANGYYYQDGENNTYAQVNRNSDAVGAKDAYYTKSGNVYTLLSNGLPFETTSSYCYKTGEEEVAVYNNIGSWKTIQYVLENSNGANIFYKKNNDGTYEQYWPVFNNNGASSFRLYYQDSDNNWVATDRMVQGLTADKYFYRDGEEEGNYTYTRSAANQQLDGTDVYYNSGSTTMQNTYSTPQTYYSSGKTWYTYNQYNGTYTQININWWQHIVNQDYYYATGVTTPNIVSADNTNYVANRTYYTDATGETEATTVTFDQDYFIPVYGYTAYNSSTDEGKTRYNQETYYRTYVAATDDGATRYCPVMQDNEFPTVTKSYDYRGWHQFVLNAFAANTTEDVVPLRSYIIDTDWWTICLPYDLTKKEMMLLYGKVTPNNSTGAPTLSDAANDIPELCVLSNVVRYEDRRHITLNFSDNLMTKRFVKNSTTKIWEPADGTNGAEAGVPADNEVVLHKGVPYLIRPKFDGTVRLFDIYGGSNVNQAFSKGRIAVSNDAYPGLADKLAAAQLIAGEDFREMMEDNIYTVPALLPVTKTGENTYETGSPFTETYVQTNGTPEVITIGSDENAKYYYRSAAFDYTFVGSLAKAIIPPFSYFLGYTTHACFVYADYTTDKFAQNKKANTPDYQNQMLWNNNSCVICPNMLSSSVTNAGSYSLGLGSHNGKVTKAENDGTAGAQWKIYGTNVTPILTDDLYHSSSVASQTAMEMMFGMDMTWRSDDETTAIIRVNGVEITPTTNRVYSLNGQYVGNSLEGLAKGIYIVNGKKVMVK